jgi:hypothetical protein
VEVIKNENCVTCESNISVKNGDRICEVFNLPLEMFNLSTLKYGCNNYVKDVKKVQELPEETKIKGRDYILWDRQLSQSGAELSAEIIGGRVPKSFPEILKLEQESMQIFGVYVRKVMNGD